MISRSSSLVGTTRRTMSTTVASATAPPPAFPPPIPITYSWSTPNALRRLSLPPLATAPPPSIPGPSRSRPVGARPLPRPPREYHQAQPAQIEEFGQIPFPDPYVYQLPRSMVHHYQPTTAQHHIRSDDYLIPLVVETNRLSFSEPFAPPERERERGRSANKPEKKEKNGGVERRLSVSGIMARFRKRSRSRSRSATRDGTRNLLDDE